MKEVQAVSLVTVAEVVKGAGPEQIRPHLPLLVPALLESLSGMEVPFLPPLCHPLLSEPARTLARPCRPPCRADRHRSTEGIRAESTPV